MLNNVVTLKSGSEVTQVKITKFSHPMYFVSPLTLFLLNWVLEL